MNATIRWDAAREALLIEARAEVERLKAKLARCVEALDFLLKANQPHDCPHDWCEACFIEKALAAAKGE